MTVIRFSAGRIPQQGCSTNPYVELYDLTSSAIVSGSLLTDTGSNLLDTGTVSLALTSGHAYVPLSQAGVTCTAQPTDLWTSAEYSGETTKFSGISQSGAISVGNAGNDIGYFTPKSDVTLTRLLYSRDTEALGCAVWPSVAIFGDGLPVTGATVTDTGSSIFYGGDSGPITVLLRGGQPYTVHSTLPGSNGCAQQPVGTRVTLQYTGVKLVISSCNCAGGGGSGGSTGGGGGGGGSSLPGYIGALPPNLTTIVGGDSTTNVGYGFDSGYSSVVQGPDPGSLPMLTMQMTAQATPAVLLWAGLPQIEQKGIELAHLRPDVNLAAIMGTSAGDGIGMGMGTGGGGGGSDPPASKTFNITSCSANGTSATVVGTGAEPNPSQLVSIQGLTSANCALLNSWNTVAHAPAYYNVTSSTPTSFTFPFVTTAFSSTADTGTATLMGMTINLSVDGGTAADEVANYATTIHLAALQAQANNQPCLLIDAVGGNDILSGTNNATLQGYLTTLWTEMHADHCAIARMSILPAQGAFCGLLACYTQITAQNQWMQSQLCSAILPANPTATACIDYWIPWDLPFPNNYNAQFYQSDHLHPRPVINTYGAALLYQALVLGQSVPQAAFDPTAPGAQLPSTASGNNWNGFQTVTGSVANGLVTINDTYSGVTRPLILQGALSTDTQLYLGSSLSAPYEGALLYWHYVGFDNPANQTCIAVDGNYLGALPGLCVDGTGAVAAGTASFGTVTQKITVSSVPQIIYDNDFYTDAADIYALQALMHWADMGQVKILAVTTDSPSDYAAPTVNIIDSYYGRTTSTIPIGAYQGGTSSGYSAFYPAIVSQFNPGDTRANYPSCLTVMRTVLANSSGGVILVGGGFGTCFSALFNSPADGISPLTGQQLIKAKVAFFAMNAGEYPSSGGGSCGALGGPEYNFCTYDPADWSSMLASWTVPNGFPPIYFTSYTAGINAGISGPPASFPQSNPVQYGAVQSGTPTRPVWDILSLYYAIFGNSASAFTLTSSGTNTVNSSTGGNVFSTSTANGQYYANLAQSAAFYEALFDGSSNTGAEWFIPYALSGSFVWNPFECQSLYGCLIPYSTTAAGLAGSVHAGVNTVGTPLVASFTANGPATAPASSGSAQTGQVMQMSTTSTGYQVLNAGFYPSTPFGSWLQSWTTLSNTGFPLFLNPSGGPVEIGSTLGVGLGTTAPQSAIQSNIAAAAAPATSGTTQSGSNLRLGNTAGNAVLDFGQYASGTYAAWIQGTNSGALGTTYPIQINPNGGAVVAGAYTASPSVALQANLTAAVAPASSGSTQSGAAFRVSNNVGLAVLDFGQYPSAPYGAWIQGENSGALGTTYPISLNPNGGNVGIGTTAPGSILTVKGGDAFVDGSAKGLILRDTVVTTNCYRITIASGVITPTLVTCPTD